MTGARTLFWTCQSCGHENDALCSLEWSTDHCAHCGLRYLIPPSELLAERETLEKEKAMFGLKVPVEVRKWLTGAVIAGAVGAANGVREYVQDNPVPLSVLWGGGTAAAVLGAFAMQRPKDAKKLDELKKDGVI